MATRYQKKFIDIKVGDTFSSYDEVKEKITTVQQQSQVPLLLRDCVTLNGAVRRRPNIAILANPALEYHSLHYICVCGRRDANRTQTYIRLGISPEYLSSEHAKCDAEIKFGLTKDYQQLEVKKINDIHNHKISQKLYKIISLSKIAPSSSSSCLTSQDYMDSDSKRHLDSLYEGEGYYEEVTLNSDNDQEEYYLGNGQTKKRKYVEQNAPLIITKRSKDDDTEPLSEVSPKIKRIRGRRIAFKHLTEQMYSVGGANCEIYEDGMKPYALFFQTEQMENNFEAYPEVLIVDSSYEISALRIYVHVLMNADGNGQCTIVGFCFAMEEKTDIVSFLVKTFLKFNPESCQTKSVMVDYSFCSKYSKIVMSHFPNATSFMCYRYAVRAYKTKVSSSKGIAFQNTQEKDTCAELFHNMALAKDEKSYRASFNRFKLYAPPALYNYFLLNWHRKKSQWVDFLKDSNSSFLNQKNSGMEQIDHNVTRVCNAYESVPSFFSLLLSTVSSMQLERKQKAVNIPTKGPIVTSQFRMSEIQYRNFLTPYAYSLVKEQIRSSVAVKILDNDEDAEQCTVVSPKYGEIHCTPTSCPCMVFTVMGLPCCHVFAVRNVREMPAFSKSLCKRRWSLQHLRKSLDLDMDDVGLVPDAYFGSRVGSENEHLIEPNAGSVAEGINAGGVARTIDELDIKKEKDESPARLYCEEMVIDEVDPDADVHLFDNLEEANDGEPIETDGAIDWADMLEAL